ncbi:hypothetical protein ACFSL4_33860 [Streptomyces caeni]|uniref:Uncharacterized protein n=1 Tax=Streptomyces caeni TaxID=2307231 RepID=A0ABW4J1M8_9ACTN
MRTPHFRGHRPDSVRNPLERPSDRLERRLRLLLTALLAVALPAAAWLAGSATHHHYRQLRQAQLAERHPVAARLLSDAQAGLDRPGGDIGARAPVRWRDSGGAHVAVAPVASGERKGATVIIWLDTRGRVTAPPVTRDVNTTVSVGVGLAAATAVALGLGGAWRGVRLSLDRRRLARWGREWELVEPRWTRHRGR